MSLRVLSAPGWELLSLGGLLCFYFLGQEFGGEDAYESMNLVGPALLTVILALGAARMAKLDANSIWTSLFWFRIATGIYFGLGTLAPAQANLTTKLYLDVFFRPQPEHIFILNIIVTCSVLIVLTMATVADRAWPPHIRVRPKSDTGLLLAGIAFAAVGFPIRLLLIVPYALGEFGDEGLPGIVQTLGLLAPVSIYLLTRYASKQRPILLPLLLLSLLADVTVGVLMNNKSEVITSVMMFLLGYLTRGLSVLRVTIAVASVSIVLAVIVPITDFGRYEAARRHGTIVGGELSERWEIVNLYFKELGALPVDEELQTVMVRISYANAAAFAIDQYDLGRPGRSLDNAWTVFIPRFLWPEKPSLTNIGGEFNALATNNENSASSPTIFAEAYWDFGWAGIPLLMFPLGVVHALISRYAMWALHGERWLYFPLVLLGMRMGHRVDGFYVADILGPVVIFVAIHFVISIVEEMLLHLRGPKLLWRKASFVSSGHNRS